MAIQFSPEIQQLLTERLSVLPDAIGALIDDGLRALVSTVKEKYDLSLEQEVSLENELALTLLGFEPVSALTQNLIDSGFPESNAGAVAKDAIAQLPQEVQSLLTELEVPEEKADAPSANPVAQEEAPATTPERITVQTQAHTESPTPTPQPAPTPETPTEHEAIRPDTTERAPGSSLTKSRTMGSDVENIHKESENTVPRYARPLTDTPRYD